MIKFKSNFVLVINKLQNHLVIEFFTQHKLNDQDRLLRALAMLFQS